MARTYRLQVPLKPEARKALEDYAEALGVSSAVAASNIITESAPALVELSVALSKAKSSPTKALRQAADYLHKYLEDANQMALELDVKTKGKQKK